MPKSRPRLVLGALASAGLVVVLAGCGSSKPSTQSTSHSTPAPAANSAPKPKDDRAVSCDGTGTFECSYDVHIIPTSISSPGEVAVVTCPVYVSAASPWQRTIYDAPDQQVLDPSWVDPQVQPIYGNDEVVKWDHNFSRLVKTIHIFYQERLGHREEKVARAELKCTDDKAKAYVVASVLP